MTIGTVIGAIARMANRTLGSGGGSGDDSTGFGDIFKSLIGARVMEAERKEPDTARTTDDGSLGTVNPSPVVASSTGGVSAEPRTFDPGMLALFHSIERIADAPEDGAGDPDGPAPRSDLTVIRSDSMGGDRAPTEASRPSTASFAGDLAPALTFSRGPIGSDPVVGITPKAEPPVMADEAAASTLGSSGDDLTTRGLGHSELPEHPEMRRATPVITDDALSSEDVPVDESGKYSVESAAKLQSGTEAAVRTAPVNASPTSAAAEVVNATADRVIRSQVLEREVTRPVVDQAQERLLGGETSNKARAARVPSSSPSHQPAQSVDRGVRPTAVVLQEGTPPTQDVGTSTTLSADDPRLAQVSARPRSDMAPHPPQTGPLTDRYSAAEHTSAPTVVRHVAGPAVADASLQTLTESTPKIRFDTQRDTSDDRERAARPVEADAGRQTANDESHHRSDQSAEDLQIRPGAVGSGSRDTPTLVLRDNVVHPADLRMTHTSPAAGSDAVDGPANVARVSEAPTLPTGNTTKATGVATIRVSDETGAEARVRVSVRGGHVTTRIVHDDPHVAQQLSARADELHGSLAARGFEGARTSIRAVQPTSHHPGVGVSATGIGMVGEPHATSDGRHSQRDGDEPRRSPHHQEQDEQKQDERSHGRSRRDQERERKHGREGA